MSVIMKRSKFTHQQIMFALKRREILLLLLTFVSFNAVAQHPVRLTDMDFRPTLPKSLCPS